MSDFCLTCVVAQKKKKKWLGPAFTKPVQDPQKLHTIAQNKAALTWITGKKQG